MPTYCSHEPLSQRTKSCLGWDEYQEAAYEMWEFSGSLEVSPRLIEIMADRLRELFPERRP